MKYKALSFNKSFNIKTPLDKLDKGGYINIYLLEVYLELECKMEKLCKFEAKRSLV